MYEVGSNILSQGLRFLDRLFDWLYGSKFNPLYRSGTLAVSLLAIATVSGVLLLFFYRLSAPYESIQAMDADIFLSRWLRTLHRYSSDLSVLAVVFHIFRMVAEKRNWGARTLAWLTGVALLLLMSIIGWTGLILLWDQQAQALAMAGAEIAGVIPFLSGLKRAVSGATPVGSSFFFLNLFLHMSLPLGMIILLWVHTSKLNKPKWFLERKYFLATSGILIIFSFLRPAPLAEAADLLKLNIQYPLDIFYSYFIPLVDYFNPGGALVLAVFSMALLAGIPFIWKPQKEMRPKVSVHNPAACTGCGQCDLDCPFEAIDMIPRTEGTGSETVAFVDTSACVGCGICSASCSQMAIGPEDKSSRLQMQKIKELKAQSLSGSVLYVRCQRSLLPFPQGAIYNIDCTGNFHVAAAAFALGHFTEVQIMGCPPEACTSRLGQQWMEERFLKGREPEAPARMDFTRVKVINTAPKPTIFQVIKILLATLGLLFIASFLSAVPYGQEGDQAVLRVAIRLPGQISEICRDRTEAEIAAMPLHMRSQKLCERKALAYRLFVAVDGVTIIENMLMPGGVHGDKPLTLLEDHSVSPGTHKILVELTPIVDTESDDSLGGALKLRESFEQNLEKGRVILISYNPTEKKLFHSDTAVK